jgi:hypothetical protein
MAQYISMHPPSGTTSLSEKNGFGFGENSIVLAATLSRNARLPIQLGEKLLGLAPW